MLRRSKDVGYWVLALAVAAGFALLTFHYTTRNTIQKDAAQNTRAAYHLVHAGVISLDKEASETPAPAMRREPLPIVATAGFFLVHPAFAQPYTIPELLDGRLTKTVKGVNAFWRFLVAIFLFLLCRELFPDWRVAAMMALLCLIASESFFLSRPGVVDRMYTELPEVAMMLLASWCAVRFVRGKTKTRALWLGVTLGLLALCKAAFLYIGLGFILLLFVTDRSEHFQASPGKPAWRPIVLTYAVIALAMFATITPWIVRNVIIFGNPQIAAGTDVSVLGTRLLLTEQPLLGQLYLYSPYALKQRVFGPLTGYGEDDLKPGGRLEAATTAKTNKSTTFAERIEAEGYQGDRSVWVKGKVFNYVVEHPLRYVASIPVFAYKGMWFMDRAGPLLNLLMLLGFFGVFFGALFTRNQVLLAAFGLPTGLFSFISIFTHALTRYNQPMTPFVILSVLWLIVAVARATYRRFPRLRALVDPCLRLIQPASEAKSSSQRRPTAPTSSAETASRA